MVLPLLLIFLPVGAALLVLFLRPLFWHYIVVSSLALVVSSIALYLYLSPFEAISFTFSSSLELLLIVLDVLLLLFFAKEGLRLKHSKVLSLALLQLILYGAIEATLNIHSGAALILDQLSVFMFLIINIVGSAIIFYALAYMKSEEMSALRKRIFIVYLLLFISVMNLIVMANSLMLFFFLFEITTLASYLLIGFRKDETAVANALKALWMNQIGGVVILIAALIASSQFNTLSFDTLLTLSGGSLLVVMAFLAMAALVKGASVPFDGWLLGAMVAPTPVSAILHSATMVKIAPYLILKISPLLAGTFLGGLVSSTGALGFVAASYLALSRSQLKEILGFSTIALLGVMISLAAIGTPETVTLAMVLIFFHAFSKAILFLSAGVLEKNFHFKNIEQMKGMIRNAPKSVGFILFGFISLTLPPFGLFMGKLFAITSISQILETKPWLLVVLAALIVGSALLVLLYFKVASALLSQDSDTLPLAKEQMGWGYSLPLGVLTLFSIFTALWYLYVAQNISLWLLVLPVALVVLMPLIVRKLNSFDRVKVYHCGEKESFDSALFYFSSSNRIEFIMRFIFALLFIGFITAGVFS